MKKRKTAQQIKLNLGCGYDHRQGYLNLDIDPQTNPDVVHDLSQPLPFAENTVFEIILQDVLEHFTLEDGKTVLLECQRVLTKKGKLLLRVPNLKQIYRKYCSQSDLLALFVYGDTSKNGVWGAHKAGYDPSILERVLRPTELRIESWQIDDTNYCFTLKKRGFAPIMYTVPGHRPAPVLPEPGFALEVPRHSGAATHILAENWWEWLQAPLWRAQHHQVLWLLPTTFGNHPLEILLAKLLLRPLTRLVDTIFIYDQATQQTAQKLLRFSHLKIIQI